MERQILAVLQELIELQDHGLAHQDSIVSKTVPLKWTQKSLRSFGSPKQTLLSNAVRNPQSAQARQLIAAVYGVQNPSASMAHGSQDRGMLAAAAILQRGLCSQHGLVLDRYGHR